MTLKPIYKEVIRKMQEQGRVTNLSQAWAYNFEDNIAMKFAPVKEEFYRKERASRYYSNKLESISAEI
jgi:hypothetical protein